MSTKNWWKQNEKPQKGRIEGRTDRKQTPSDCHDLHLFSSAIHAKELIGKRNSKRYWAVERLFSIFFLLCHVDCSPHIEAINKYTLK